MTTGCTLSKAIYYHLSITKDKNKNKMNLIHDCEQVEKLFATTFLIHDSGGNVLLRVSFPNYPQEKGSERIEFQKNVTKV